MNDEDDEDLNDMYMTIIYKNKFKKNITKKLLNLENSNDNKLNSGIATKGYRTCIS